MVPIDLDGRRALVTGIGRACVAILARAGARVAVADINLAGAQQTAARWPGSVAYRCDLADHQSISAMVAGVVSDMGAVEIMVNCAGIIVHVSSLAARAGAIETGIHYSAAKAGLIGLVRTLAKEGAPHGVAVNAVAPGIIATEPVMKKISDHVEDYLRLIPMGRLGQPEDVASVILFLCSSLSDYITGATIDINGGQYMG